MQGVPPVEPSPLGELAESFARVAGDPDYVLSYGDSEGHAPLREAIADGWLASAPPKLAEQHFNR